MNAELCSKAFEDQDLPAIGRLLSEYWTQKKVLAPSCEPVQVSTFLKRSSDFIHGGTMAGAGGGGFMFVLLKRIEDENRVIEIANNCFSEPIVYDLELDVNGIEVEVNGQCDAIP
jgi:fucokinase